MKREVKLAIILVSVIVFEIFAFFCGYYLGRINFRKGDKSVAPVAEQAIEKIEPGTAVDDIIKNMTLEEKVYQMMFVTPESITGVAQVIQAGEGTREALVTYPVGGIIYFSQNFEGREQTATMISNTQQFSKIPLFIAVDEEGGSVARLGKNESMGVTQHPTMREIGDSGDESKAKEIGTTLAKDLSALGFNVDFAPVADVVITEENKAINTRSFGSDAVLVSKMVKNVVAGLEGGNVSATLKHFPGHGSVVADTHDGAVISERTIEQLRECEFLPFKAGIDVGVDFIMLAHITLKNAAKEQVPSSMSKEVIGDMLRGELGYKGIIITDALNMSAITSNYSAGDAAAGAVAAGVDMILMPSDVKAAHTGIVNAVKNGTIPEERINESVKRILTLKREKGLI